MATEDFTGYTEVDPNNRITVTSSRVTATDIERREDAYVYDDKGVDHFDGDFEHLLDVFLDDNTGAGIFFVWSLANVIDDVLGINAVNGDLLGVYFKSSNELNIFEIDGGSTYKDTYSCSLDTTYYLKVKRDENVGTYGTFYCYIYSDAARTNLLDTLSIALHSSKKDFRYVYAGQTYNDGSSFSLVCYCENLDLQEAVGLSIPVAMRHFRNLRTAVTRFPKFKPRILRV